MNCRFRYGTSAFTAVALRLFQDDDGTPRGDVCGPLVAEHNGKPTAYVDRCILDAEQAYFAAIRIANASDCEVVVSGDVALWNKLWGELVFEPTAALA